MSTHKTRHSFSSMVNDILRIERYIYILHVAINKLYTFCQKITNWLSVMYNEQKLRKPSSWYFYLPAYNSITTNLIFSQA